MAVKVLLGAAVLAGGAVLTAASAQRTTPELTAVLASTAKYVAAYDAAVWAVIAEERYQQSATRSGSRQQQRILRSDVLLASDGSRSWIWLRDVLDVDGVSMRREPERLFKLLTTPPFDSQGRALQIMREGNQYHLGSLARTIDPPTLDLVFLRRENQSHARFSLDGTKSIDGTSYTVITFKEASELPGLPFFAGTVAEGKFWVDAGTGRVVQTETRVRSKSRSEKVTVRYGDIAGTGLWLPTRLDEEYYWTANMPGGAQVNRSDVSDLVTGRAEYRNYRKMTIDPKTIRRQSGGSGGDAATSDRHAR